VLELDLGVLDGLEGEILEGIGPEVEVGGLLLGRAATRPKPAVVVAGFVPVRRRTTGGQELLAGLDEAELQNYLQRCPPAPDAPLQLVGLFRSHQGDELFLTAEERELVRRLAPVEPLVLLVKVLRNRPMFGAFYLAETGELGEAPAVLFPLDRSKLR